MGSRFAMLLITLGLLAAPASAGERARGAGFTPGGDAPMMCSGEIWTDRVGTPDIDVVWGERRPQRLYGLSGTDWLIGSDTRASCLFGGDGNDVLVLGTGGGIAIGEEGRDLIHGATKTDGLSGGPGEDKLKGGPAGDVLRGDEGLDMLVGQGGDDILDARDGVPEIVDCGPGADTALADRSDVLMGCERRHLRGRALPLRKLNRRKGGSRTVFKARFVSPEWAPRGRFRVLVAAPGCEQGRIQVARSRALRRGQHAVLRLRPPRGGWCPGAYSGAIVRTTPCPAGEACPGPPPPEPLARLGFLVR